MTAPKSWGKLRFPARTYIVDSSVAHPVLPFVQALTQKKLQVVSAPGQSPIKLRYGTMWKSVLLDNEFIPSLLLPKKAAALGTDD